MHKHGLVPASQPMSPCTGFPRREQGKFSSIITFIAFGSLNDNAFTIDGRDICCDNVQHSLQNPNVHSHGKYCSISLGLFITDCLNFDRKCCEA